MNKFRIWTHLEYEHTDLGLSRAHKSLNLNLTLPLSLSLSLTLNLTLTLTLDLIGQPCVVPQQEWITHT